VSRTSFDHELVRAHMARLDAALRAVPTAAAAASLSLAACASSSSVHDQRVVSTGVTRLVIDDTSSDLRVVPGNGPRIQVQRWLSGTAAKPGHSSWTLQGDTLRLGIDCSGLVISCGSRFEVAVPPATGITVNSGSNTVIISSLSAAVTVNGNEGDVHVSGVSGPLQVSTGSGQHRRNGAPVLRRTRNGQPGERGHLLRGRAAVAHRQMLSRERNGQGADRPPVSRPGQQRRRQRLLEGAR
jgi:hypothetical protein